MLVLIIIEFLILIPLLTLLVYHIIKSMQRKKLKLDSSLLTQKDINKDMESFALRNQGRSLNLCRIYAIPYSNMGYSED